MSKHIFVVDKRQYLIQRFTFSEKTGQHESRKRYRVALGMPEYPTPSGVFTIHSHAFNPDWKVPNSDWVAPEWRGKIIPGGSPDNPLKGAFMDLAFLGIGIHGTSALDSLGTRASHGCIRVKPEAAIEIANLGPDGSIVVIL